VKEWELQVSYKLKQFKLKTQLEYHSDQIMRIRVFGKAGSLLLENNYPAHSKTKSTRGLKWKIREGSLGDGTADTSSLLVQIMGQLENIIKKEFPPDKLLFED
jgi:hypothetical protein